MMHRTAPTFKIQNVASKTLELELACDLLVPVAERLPLGK